MSARDVRSSILLMAYGQSNADAHPAGPRLPSLHLDDPRIVTPDDGAGISGHRGLCRQSAFAAFRPAARDGMRVQTVLQAAAARLLHELPGATTQIVIRSAARGGRRLLGIMQGDRAVEGLLRDHDGSASALYHNAVATIRETVATARATGAPVRAVYILWLHGESDRALPRDAYATLFLDLVRRIGAETAHLGVPLRWLTVQPGGTATGGGGNDWPNRLSLFDAAVTAQTTPVAAGHLCRYEDQSHYSAGAKAMLGEWLGHVVAKLERGIEYRLPAIRRAEISGARLDLLLPAWASHFAPLLPRGLVVREGRQDVAFTAQMPVQRRLTLHLSRHVSPDRLSVAYAFSRNTRPDRSVPVQRAHGWGNLRTTYQTASILRPGRTLWEPLPAFQLGPEAIHSQAMPASAATPETV